MTEHEATTRRTGGRRRSAGGADAEADRGAGAGSPAAGRRRGAAGIERNFLLYRMLPQVIFPSSGSSCRVPSSSRWRETSRARRSVLFGIALMVTSVWLHADVVHGAGVRPRARRCAGRPTTARGFYHPYLGVAARPARPRWRPFYFT